MLGRTAGGLFWMCRYLERSENIARLVEAGFRMSLTRSTSEDTEWASVLTTAGCDQAYRDKHGEVTQEKAIDYLIRDKTNPSSVISVFTRARDNARMTRTALTLELWEAINESWLTLKDALKRPISMSSLTGLLALIRRQSALVRGTLNGTLLRNDIFSFCTIGTVIERAEQTARILDVKYYVLLPTTASVGSPLDNVQWEMLLRSTSAERSFHWLNEGESSPAMIAEFLILDPQMPRSLAFCYQSMVQELASLARIYGGEPPASHDLAERKYHRLMSRKIENIFDMGLHEFLGRFIGDIITLSNQIEADYRFNV